MILLVIALVGVSGYAVSVSYGPKLWSEDAGTVAFAAASLSVFTVLVSNTCCGGDTYLPARFATIICPMNLLSPEFPLTLRWPTEMLFRSALCCCGATSPAFWRIPAASRQARPSPQHDHRRWLDLITLMYQHC